jgi:predicted nucleic acid-binding protein
MKRLLFDTNVVLDVLLDRSPHAAASAAAWAAIESRRAKGLIAAHSVTTLHYLISRELGAVQARRIIGAVLQVFEVAPVSAAILDEALNSPLSDFEDAVTAASARAAKCDLIVTHDLKGFRGAPVNSVAPASVPGILSACNR